MATFYVNGSAASNGNGSSGSPYNAVPANTLTASNTWLFDRSGVLDMGGAQLSCGNNVIVGAYGSGSGPAIIQGAPAVLFNCSTANSPILVEDIHFRRTGAQGGFGIQAVQMSGGSASFTMRRCVIEGFNTNLTADRSKSVTLDRVTFLGSTTTFAITGTATGGNNCDDWTITNCDFKTGGGLLLSTSTSTSTTGAWNRLRIIGNRFSGSTANDINLGCATTLANAAWYLRVTAPSTIEAFTDAGGTVPLDMPAWAPGATVFLAGFGNRANFGLFTVSSVVTNTLVVTETSLITEILGRNKGIHHRDATRAYVDPVLNDNVFSSPGATPMNLTAMRGGVVRNNKISNGRGVGYNTSGIELINALGTIVENNDVDTLVVSAAIQSVDGNGIMADGAAENCIIRSNVIRNIPGTGATNSGSGIAAFEAKACELYGNVLVNCYRGFGAAGPGTTVNAHNNTFVDCAAGFVIGSGPAAGAVKFRNNVIQGCALTGTDAAASTVSNNAYWRNASGSNLGTAPITTDPLLDGELKPVAASPMITAGVYIGPRQDFNGAQFWNPPAVGAFEYKRPRLTRT